ncbi:MAG: SDR family oxidoreductase [Caldilineae bacterium]|nr:MAG: SDR family oxidoreductase [Caldilineae bacterium]
MQRILITGANRGIGLELVRQCMARGDRVFAGCRQPVQANTLRQMAASHPNQLTLLSLDVTSRPSIASALATAQSKIDGLDVLVNNAGYFPRGEKLESLDPDVMLYTFHVNTVGPVSMIQAFLPLLRKGRQPRVLNISSQLGAITLAQNGRHHSYNSSKAALNMLTRILAVELKDREIIVVAIHPGWVKTDMGGAKAPLTPEESVAGILSLADRLSPEDSGLFFTWKGERHPW